MKAYVEELKSKGIQDLGAYFDAHPEAVFDCLNQANVLDVNRATLELYQAESKEDLLGAIEAVLDKDYYSTYLEGILSIAEGRTTFEIETVNRTLQGTEIDIILSWSVAPGSEGSYDRVLVSIVDISERKRIERSEREQRSLAEALRDISSALSSTLDYEEVLDRILENIARVAAFDTAHILLVENGTARMVRWRGYDRIATGPVDVGPLTFKIEEVHNLRQMAESGLPLVIADTREFSGWVDIPELRFIRSFAGAPICVRGQVTGFLNITSQNPGFFSSVDAPRLQALADQAAIALENSRLYEQVISGRERMRLLTQQVVSAQEEERHRLSRELHDEAGQSLTALQIGLQLVHDEISPDQAALRREVKESIALAEATMDRMRFLAQNLRPPALDAIGLVPTLKDLSEEYALRSGLSLRFSSDSIPDLSDEVNVCLYRFLQEALTNVIKHARAKHIVVALHGNDREVTLSVGDDGRGFDPLKTTPSAEKVGGIGLLGMQERLELIGGKLELKSALGSGTTLVARVPNDADHLERRQSHDTRHHRR
jgi:signal transduction histidine kinase